MNDLVRVGDQFPLFVKTELAAEMYVDEALTDELQCVRLDIPGSVSGSPPPGVHWEDAVLLEDKYQRFLNGS